MASPVLRLAAVLLALALSPAVHAAPQKVLRVPFLIAETNFDPAFVSDTYSATVNDEIFESPYTYDMLARPYKVIPQTAEAMPEWEGSMAPRIAAVSGETVTVSPTPNSRMPGSSWVQ